MSNANDETTVPTEGNTRLTGRVKWFNNKAGFGFVTVLDGEKSGEDIFVHHSGIIVESEQYKYLVQGEYVSLELRKSDNQEHPYQAGEVRGVANGMLMCETRNANRVIRDGEDGEESSERKQRPRRNPRNRARRKSSDEHEKADWSLNRTKSMEANT